MLVGGLGVGKTVVARRFNGHYYDLRQPIERKRLLAEWRRVIRGEQRVILDDSHLMPELFPLLLGELNRLLEKPFRKILLVSPVLPSRLRELPPEVARHIKVAKLSPLMLCELGTKGDLDRLWFYGGYADGGLFSKRNYPSWQQSHLRRLVEDKLPRLGIPTAPDVTFRLLQELAAAHGQPWNASATARRLQLDYRKVDAYVDFLDDAFLVRKLPAFAADTNKRVTRRPIVYLRDSGLRHALLGIGDLDELHDQGLSETSWTGFVIEQFLAFLDTERSDYKVSHFRTSDGYGLDLVLEIADEVWVFQMLPSTSVNQRDTALLQKVADMIGADVRVLVVRSKQSIEHGNAMIVNLPWLFEKFEHARLWSPD